MVSYGVESKVELVLYMERQCMVPLVGESLGVEWCKDD